MNSWPERDVSVRAMKELTDQCDMNDEIMPSSATGRMLQDGSQSDTELPPSQTRLQDASEEESDGPTSSSSSDGEADYLPQSSTDLA